LQRLRILLQSKIFIILSLLFIFLYILLFTKIIKYNSNYEANETTIIGTLIDYKIDGDKLSLIIKGKEKVSVTYYISSLEEKQKLKEKIKLGIKLEVNGIFKEPINNTIPNTFNYKKYLYNKKIYKIMNADKIKFINNKINIIYKIKNYFLDKINKFNLTKEYMYAFVLGDNGYIDSDVYKYFKNNGVTHLFAVSGMHITFLIMAISIFLKKIHIKNKIIDLIVIIFLFFYMFLIGFSVSVVRASLLYILLLINKKLNIKINSIYILYLLFIILLIINPFYIYDLGFIYSFLTSFGLMIFNKKITGNYFSKLIKVSVIAFLFSLPITLYNFYEFNLLTILNNIIIVPLVSIILFPLSLITFIFPFFECILNLGFNILELINKILDLISINIIVPKINIIFIIIYYFIIYLIYKKGFKYIFLLSLLILTIRIKPYIDSNKYVYYLDVGQGDSSLVITENKKDVILIDTGGKIEYSKEEWQKRNSSSSTADNITTFIKSLGINKIDTLICTHGDYDHMGEATNLVNNFKVEKVIFNCGEFNDLEQELIKVLDKKKIPYYSCIKELNIDDNKLYFLNNKDYSNENDNSNVIYTELNNYNFLFMGDAGVEVEEDLIQNYNLQNIDVLKVGHHGSKTSSSKKFIDEINPKYSIISVGKNNRYGHPNDSVLDNLVDSKIYRTDQDGSIMFKIKNNKLKIETCRP